MKERKQEKHDQRLLDYAVQRSTIPHGNTLTKWNFSMRLQRFTNLTLCLIVNLMFSHQKKGGKKGRKECKNAVMEIFNRIIEVKNAGGASSELKSDNTFAEKG